MRWHPIVFSKEEQAFMDYMSEEARTLAHRMAIPPQLLGKVTESNHPVIVESCCQREDKPMEEKTPEPPTRDTQFAGFARALVDELRKVQQSSTTLQSEKIIAQRAYDLTQHAVGYTLEYLHDCGLRTPGSMNLSIQPSIPDMTTLPEVSKPDTKYCTVCGVVYVQDTPGWYEHHALVQDHAFK